jgi:hypothetical protein
MQRTAVSPQHAGAERRSSNRFPLSLELRYSLWNAGGPKITGSGRTIDLSSTGLSFTADKPLAVGQRLDVSIHWPVQFEGCAQLQLALTGEIVRTDGDIVALRFAHHEFKTRSLGPKLLTDFRKDPNPQLERPK